MGVWQRQASTMSWKSARTDLFFVLPFLLFFLVQLVHHEMWRDELNAWGLVVASPNPVKLYQHIRYEGHPSLWYILLWFPSRFTSSPVAMQCLQALVGIGIYLMIALRAPFSRIEKVLLYMSYFISFEYTVMSRMYGVCVLLVFVYAYRRSRYPHQVLLNTVLLALIANTDMVGLILSGALLFEYAIASYGSYRRGELAVRKLGLGAAIYVAGVAAVALALRISPNISWRTTGRPFESASDPRHFGRAVVNYILLPWMPISTTFPNHFWNPWVEPPTEHLWMFALATVIVLMYAYIFRRDWLLGSIVFLAITVAILFGHFVYMGSTRHWGIGVVALLAALWMQRYRRPQFSVLVIALLAFSSVSGVQAAIAQWHHPFSQARNTIHWLRDHNLENAAIVGSKDTSVAGIAIQMQRPMYFLDCNCRDTFLLFSNRRDDFIPESIPGRLVLASTRLNARDMIFIATDPLPPASAKRVDELGLNLKLLASFTGAEDWEENYFIYRVHAR